MDRDLVIKKLRRWEMHFELVVGTLAFGLAIGCAGINNHFVAVVASLISLYICFKAIDLGNHHFPEELLELRENPRKTKRELIEHAYAELQLDKMKTPIIYLGMLSLLIVFFMSVLSFASII